MKKRAIIGIVCVALALVLAVGLIVVNVMQTKQMTTAYVTTSELPEGTQITSENIKEVSVHKSDASSVGYVSSADEIVGKFAKVDLVSGDIITSNNVSNTAEATDNQFLSIPSGKQAISFSVKGGADSVSNKLQVGDIIRVYSYNSDGEVVSPDELKYVQVASVTSSDYKDVDASSDNTASDSDTETPSYSTITVIVYTNQVEQLIKIQNEGGAYVTLLSRGSTDTANQLLEAQDQLLEGGTN